jgi:hypothetical protein
MTKKLFLIFAIFFLLLAGRAYAFCIDRDPPSAPSNLVIQDSPYDDDGNITLTWTAATDGPCNNSAVAYYKIYRSVDGVNFDLIGTSNSTTYDDFSSLPEGKYWYNVTAVDNVIDNPHEGPGVIATTTVKFNPFCSDGTRYDTCSGTKPKYCDNGTLVDRCDICGCPAGQSCRADGTCYTPTGGGGGVPMGGGGGFLPATTTTVPPTTTLPAPTTTTTTVPPTTTTTLPPTTTTTTVPPTTITLPSAPLSITGLIALVAGNTFYQLLIALAIVAVLLTIFRYKWFLKAGKGCSSRDFLKKAKPREK